MDFTSVESYIKTPAIRDSIFIGILSISFVFYSINTFETKTLIATIVMGGIIWVWFGWLQSQKKYGEDGTVEGLNKELKVHEGMQTGAYVDNFQIGAFPKKGVKFLMKNASLVDIVKPLFVIRSFDRSRYADLILLLNQFQKTYIYVLMDRMEPSIGIPIFTDIGDSILENMYSFVFVLPDKFKHTYYVVPAAVVNDSIAKFTVLRRHMTSVLESYAKKEIGEHVVPISLPRANDEAYGERMQHRLP